MSQVDEFHMCVKLNPEVPWCALPFSVADCPHCTEADYPPTPLQQIANLQSRLDKVREIANQHGGRSSEIDDIVDEILEALDEVQL